MNEMQISMMQLFYIAIGGAAGSVSRYLLSQYVDSTHNTAVPWGTFSVNLLGALLIGSLFVIIHEKQLIHADFKYLLMVGVLGGFTTYSSFSLENFRLIEQGHLLIALSYMLGTTATCLAGVWLGVLSARALL